MSILLVEDEPMILFDLADYLTDAGFEVITADNADAALPHLPSVSLVITDVRMPGSIDGIGLARHVKAQHPNVPVILLSGEATARPVSKLADARVSKPFDGQALVATIKRLTA